MNTLAIKPNEQVSIGDLVKLGGVWAKYGHGIVLADDSAWYVIKDHFDVSGCIVDKKDILGVVKEGAVDQRMIQYLRVRG